MSEKIRSELLGIKAESSDGLLYAPTVVDWARAHPDSALHGALQWNDTIAAQEYRVWQVRQLIQIHVVTAEGAPQLVSLSIDRKGNGGYRGIDEVVKSKDLSDIMLADALAELERVQTKYARVKELTGVWEQVQQVRRSRRRNVAQTSAAASAPAA